MKYLLIVSAMLFCNNLSAKNIYSASINNLGGKKVDLSSYQGKPTLFVNIATQCGYTPQLDGLEKLYKKYKAKGLQVVGIPSNDFGGQTPEQGEEIKKFCKLNYGVSFQLTEKAVVKGEKKHPLIAKLLSGSGDAGEIKWNFEKFLVDKDGKVKGRFPSAVKPDDKKLVSQIESLL